MIEVKIDSSRPIFIAAKAADIAAIFAEANGEDQAEILRLAMAKIAAEYPIQFDHIAIELAKPEHDDTRRRLAYLIEPIPAGD